MDQLPRRNSCLKLQSPLKLAARICDTYNELRARPQLDMWLCEVNTAASPGTGKALRPCALITSITLKLKGSRAFDYRDEAGPAT